MACLYPSIGANFFLVALCNRRRPQYLYDKECILENILKQKADMKRQMKEYEAQLRKHQARQAKTDAEAKDAAFEQFVKKERGIGGASADGSVNVHAIIHTSPPTYSFGVRKQAIRSMCFTLCSHFACDVVLRSQQQAI